MNPRDRLVDLTLTAFDLYYSPWGNCPLCDAKLDGDSEHDYHEDDRSNADDCELAEMIKIASADPTAKEHYARPDR